MIALKDMPRHMRFLFEPRDYLPQLLHDALLDYAINSKDYQRSKVLSDAKDYRDSRVIYRPDRKLLDPFEEWVRKDIRERAAECGVTIPEKFRMETQLTASNDGHFYKKHPDGEAGAGRPTDPRIFTYVYYFYVTPQQFEGGNIRLYENRFDNALYEELAVADNSCVFFPSDTWHEVRMVKCPSRDFRHSRFTLNGWIRTDHDAV